MKARPIWKIKRKHLEKMKTKKLRKVHKWVFGEPAPYWYTREQLIDKIAPKLPACRR